LPETIRSLQNSVYPALRILVVDNSSGDNSIEELQGRFPGIETVRLSENRGFAGGHNVGLRRALEEDYDYAFLLNNDVTLAPDALRLLVEAAEAHPRTAILGPSVWSMDTPSHLDSAWGRILYHHVIVRTLGTDQIPKQAYLLKRNVDCVFGAALLVRCAALRRAGLLDERYWMFLEEVELCQRMRNKGYQILYLPGAQVTHLGGHSIKKASAHRLKIYLVRRNSILFMQKHGSFPRWTFFLFCMAVSLIGSFLSCAAQGDPVSWKARWEGYRDGFRGRLLSPQALFQKYTK